MGLLLVVRDLWVGWNLWRLLYKKAWYVRSQVSHSGGPHGARPGFLHLAQSTGGSDFLGLGFLQMKHLPSMPKLKLHSC